MSGYRIILASVSPRRKELLALLCPNFVVTPSNFDEGKVPSDLSPVEHTVFSATQKAEKISANHPCDIVIGADTIVVVDQEILQKPDDEEDAHRMLRRLSGRTHQVITGLCVIGPVDQVYTDYESTDVKFRSLSEEVISRYVATGEPMDKAGAYAIQGRGASLIESINGDFFNVVGLPIYKLSLLLERFGVQILTD